MPEYGHFFPICLHLRIKMSSHFNERKKTKVIILTKIASVTVTYFDPHDGINHQIIPCPRSAIKIYTSPARHTRFPELLVPAGPISARPQILGTRHQRRLKYGYVNKLPDPDQTRRLKVAPSSFREVIPTTSMKCHTLFRFILYFRFVFFFFLQTNHVHTSLTTAESFCTYFFNSQNKQSADP